MVTRLQKQISCAVLVLTLVFSLTAASGCGGREAATKDILRWAGQAEPQTLDPHDTGDMLSAMVQRQMLEGLYNFNGNCEIVPELAADYPEVSEDSKVWVIKLREGVTFHDGTPFNAEAVKANLDRLRNPDNQLVRASLMADIESVDVLGEYEVKITLKRSFGAFLANLAHYAGMMHSPASLADPNRDVAREPVGTGPYKFVEWVPGDRIAMERNPDYWGGAPYFKRIEFRPVPEDSTRVMMLESGDVDCIYPVAVHDVESLRNNPDFTVQSVPSMTNLHFQINMLKPYFQDVRVRHALNYAIDLDAIADNLYLGQAVPLDSPISPALFGHASIGAYPYDPDKARSLLADAGFEPGELNIEMWVPDGRYLKGTEVAEAVANYLSDVGVNVTISKFETATYWDFFKKGPDEAQHDLLMLGWAPSTGDPDWGMRPMFHSDMWPPTSWGAAFYENEEVDRLLIEAMKAADLDSRADLYRQAQGIIMEDAPWIFLVAYNVTGAWDADIEGIQVLALDQMIVREAYMEGE